MKLNRVFIVVIIVLMAVMLLFKMNAPSRFQWDDDGQSCYSKQPLGCYVMDSVLKASLPQGYEVLGHDINKYLYSEGDAEKHTFLLTAPEYLDIDIDVLLDAIKKGNNVVLYTFYDYYYFTDTLYKELNFYTYSYDYDYDHFINRKHWADSTNYKTINWHADDLFDAATYQIHGAFLRSHLALSDSFRILATEDTQQSNASDDVEDGYSLAVAGIREYGKGKVVVMSMPLIFTNFGILNDTTRPLALRLLSECGDLPVVRFDRTHIDKGIDDEQEQESSLRYLLSNRPLRWAFYLALATLVALVLFTARRRQRVIPVIKPPVNHMMDFVKQIGGIYYQRHDNVDLLTKKYATFSHNVRVKTMIDLNDYDHIDDELRLLSRRTGIPFNELKEQILEVRNATHAYSLSNEELKRLIDSMNHIMQKISVVSY